MNSIVGITGAEERKIREVLPAAGVGTAAVTDLYDHVPIGTKVVVLPTATPTAPTQ